FLGLVQFYKFKVKSFGGYHICKELISPDNAVPYADRSADFPYKIDREDLCYRLFTAHGFEWGGAWNSSKDYQHFQKNS
ncbi:MAG: M15 family metallopeptidase, partial [Lachnospiraceae bacterium]|nr:M15 family metallopeptidase [Lachnospiraceae bacterium]